MTYQPDTRQPAEQKQAESAGKKFAQSNAAASSFIDNRSSAAADIQRKAMMDASPRHDGVRSLRQLMGSGTAGSAAPLQLVEEEDPVQQKFQTVQRKVEEEILQGKFDTAQRADMDEDEPLQGKFAPSAPVQLVEQDTPQPNNTGLPDQLKSGIENLSGMSMDHVKVHYNSAQPAQLNAHAYAQGSDIHVAPGQEQHLPHEAWHVVQQAQGRVKPTLQMKGDVSVNDDAGLEHEADVMGAQALQMERKRGHDAVESGAQPIQHAVARTAVMPPNLSIQRVTQFAALVRDKLNIAGERHPESNARRDVERQVALAKTGSANYWREGEFTESANSQQPADPYVLRYEFVLKQALTLPIPVLAAHTKEEYLNELAFGDVNFLTEIENAMGQFYADDLEVYGQKIEMYGARTARAVWLAGLRRVINHHCGKAKGLVAEVTQKCTAVDGMFSSVDVGKMEEMVRASKPLASSLDEIIEGLDQMEKALIRAQIDFNLDARDVSSERSHAMHLVGQARAGEKGLWKVGEKHAADMMGIGGKNYNLLSRADFNGELAPPEPDSCVVM